MGIRSNRSQLSAALSQHFRVIVALILRDIKTRAGASYFGFLVGLAIPLIHILIVLSIYIIMGRRAVIGTDVTTYLATAILPFVIWSYAHQKVFQAFSQNLALTSFPIVKFDDILIARASVELLNAAMIASVTYIAMLIITDDITIIDKPNVLYAILLSYILGISTGYIFGLIGIYFTGFVLVGFIIIPIYWITCGTIFIPDALPDKLRILLYFFPLAHIVDYLRLSFYPSYLSLFPQLGYVHMIIVSNILLGLIVDRTLRSSSVNR